MEVIVKRAVYLDEWITDPPRPGGRAERFIKNALYGGLPPGPGKIYHARIYALGYRVEPTERELELIRANELFGNPFLTIRDDDPPITFADILGPELIPEVSPNQHQLLHIEGWVRQTALTWTHFFKNLDDSV